MHCLTRFCHGLLVLSQPIVGGRQTGVRSCFPWVHLSKELGILHHLLHIATNEDVVGDSDEEFFPLADSVPKLESACNVLAGQVWLSEIAIYGSQRGIRHRKIGIEGNSLFEERNRLCLSLLRERHSAQTVRLQCLE